MSGVQELKTCKACSEPKPLNEFCRHPATRDRLQQRCKACNKEATARGRKEQPHKWLIYRFRAAYGLEVPEDRAREVYECPTCEACGNGFVSSRDRTLDHCHKTGRIRGTLCNSCNAALGMLGDDPQRLNALIAYLERHGT